MSARVLVVEDDPQIRQLLVRVLELENLETESASNGLEGWQRLHEAPVDLVISDLVMPHLDGLELARRVRERYGHAVRFVLFSSLGSIQRQIADVEGIDAFLPKSVEIMELIRVTHELLGLPPSSWTDGRAER